jgi:NAD(P) transhydrogenase subunit alpha
VRSLGAEFLAVEVEQEASADGYAKATSADYDRRAEEIYAEQAADVDIIITTALIPGRQAPRLISAEHVASMRPGSVIVDMAAAQGGNVAGSVAGEVVVTDNGVSIIGYTDLPGRLPAQASQLYGTNLVNLMKLLTPGRDGQLVLDFDDVVQRSVTVVRDGAKTWPPPPETAKSAVRKEKQPLSDSRRFAIVGLGAAALFALTAAAPNQLTGNFTVFVLAIVIGYYVIGSVHHALHTPLMSVTNAISGIIVVGALLQIGHGNTAVTALSFAAILLASINIFGGFAVTRRMLGMFKKD